MPEQICHTKSTPISYDHQAHNEERRKVIGTVGRTIAALAAATAADLPGNAGASTLGGQHVSVGQSVVLSKERLDRLAQQFYKVFNEGGVLPSYTQENHAARYDVELRRITTYTRVPETGERVKVSGLLATPSGLRGPLPVVSWQHGTILSFDQVPSNLMRLADPHYTLQDNVDSLETVFNLHRLAAQGYVVIAADYLGKGPYRDGRGEAYAVRAATVQCCLDVLDAGMSMLKPLDIRASTLLLNGWSQGAINTQWLGLELHRRGIRVDAVAAESPFNNLPDSLRYWCGNLKFAPSGAQPYPALPAWLTPCLVILLGSYRTHYKLPDLFDTAIRPQYRAFAEAYWHNYALNEQMQRDMPTASEFLVEGFFERFTAQSNTNMLSHLAHNSTTYTQFEFPITFYYGAADEALPPQLVQMAVAGGGPHIQGVQVQGASHRATFLSSMYGGGDAMGHAKTVPEWFDSIRKSKRT
ncbi:MAG: hypothetical protein LWW81_04110 [Rhodocyclales bacterium]|nr:hypothetical protein [Rhodocyclales bacterium]